MHTESAICYVTKILTQCTVYLVRKKGLTYSFPLDSMTVNGPFVVFPVTITSYHYYIFGAYVSMHVFAPSVTYFITMLFCSDRRFLAIVGNEN